MLKTIKEWLLCFLLVIAYIWSWCSIISCILAPPILAFLYSIWWFAIWPLTFPAALIIIIIITKRKGN